MTEDLEDLGLTEDDWQAIEQSQAVTPPNAEEWAVYFRKLEEQS